LSQISISRSRLGRKEKATATEEGMSDDSDGCRVW